MSVSDKKYWSQRVQELANSVKPVSDTDFFSSDAYREFTENAAKDMSDMITVPATLTHSVNRERGNKPCFSII